jgi:DNA mismatch repair protein MutS
VVNHAQKALGALEAQQSETRAQVDLFAAPAATQAAAPSAVESALAVLDPDAMSPREALDALYALQKLHRREQH